jgi:hypothetical protein
MASSFTVLTGILVTLAGVGGIEYGDDLLTAAIVTVVGMMVTGVGVMMAHR